MPPSSNDVTQLLQAWGNGDKEALDKLVPLVYEELRRRAHHYMKRERAGHSLQTSALVNEAYIRLVDYNRMRWQDRAHFFAVAAQLMRRILVDHARSRGYAKRGGEARKVSLDEAAEVSGRRMPEIIALDDALTGLTRIDERKGRIVELRYFGGLSIEETAEVMGISSPTVQREWRRAKAWLHREISGVEEDEA
ncbi:MAG: sigma-70 family RNA polymerase sigma factor [Blastocatellia bacterium]|nr:sigma-70 family RNA polymerase sigma factor [Blastocatellia bacterium]